MPWLLGGGACGSCGRLPALLLGYNLGSFSTLFSSSFFCITERAGGHWHDHQDQEEHSLEGLAHGGSSGVGWGGCKADAGPDAWCNGCGRVHLAALPSRGSCFPSYHVCRAWGAALRSGCVLSGCVRWSGWTRSGSCWRWVDFCLCRLVAPAGLFGGLLGGSCWQWSGWMRSSGCWR